MLTDLSEETQRRFAPHLRPWSAEDDDFAPPAPDDAAELADAGEWCLPVVFLGRFNPDEDDFEGNTFFTHPQRPDGDYNPEELGGSLTPFRRDDKRYCGFVYLRPNRTGNRALSFGRGSLIDTIVRLESDKTGSLWTSALGTLDDIDLAEVTPGFAEIRDQMLLRMRKFLSVPDSATAVGVRPSDLTREHLREVLRMFIATQPGTYPVPFSRLSTGALNVLVFALLTYIADLRGPGSVIFAMEEPEIALPPHTQRRMVDFVTRTMGQTIVTSHSPYVIERFGPDQVVVLTRDDSGALSSRTLDLCDVKPRKYREQRRQFAEAVLANAVLVVEGGTEVRDVPGDRRRPRQRPPPSPTSIPTWPAWPTVFDEQNGLTPGVPLYGADLRRPGQDRVRHARQGGTSLTEEQQKMAESFAIHLERHRVPRHRGSSRSRDQPRRSPQVPRATAASRLRLPAAPRLPARRRIRGRGDPPGPERPESEERRRVTRAAAHRRMRARANTSPTLTGLLVSDINACLSTKTTRLRQRHSRPGRLPLTRTTPTLPRTP